MHSIDATSLEMDQAGDQVCFEHLISDVSGTGIPLGPPMAAPLMPLKARRIVDYSGWANWDCNGGFNESGYLYRGLQTFYDLPVDAFNGTVQSKVSANEVVIDFGTNDHSLSPGDQVDVEWALARRVGCAVTAVNGQIVTISGGVGDEFPSEDYDSIIYGLASMLIAVLGDHHGTVSMSDYRHPITVESEIDVFWDGGLMYRCDVLAVNGREITFIGTDDENDYVLPAVGAAINVDVHTVKRAMVVRRKAGILSSGPPQVYSAFRLTERFSNPLGSGGWPDPDENYLDLGQLYADAIGAPIQQSEFEFVILGAVPPVGFWEPGYPGTIPYLPEDAEPGHGPLLDLTMMEVPQHIRAGAYPFMPINRYVDFGQIYPPPLVPTGLPIIVAESAGMPRASTLQVYSMRTGGVAPPPYSGQLPCEPQALGASRFYLQELFWKYYEGLTATRRYVWEADSKHRGWYVEYCGYIEAWFVQNYHWIWDNCFPNDPLTCRPRIWNAWYQVRVYATIRGDLTDDNFRNFVESKPHKYGSLLTPRYHSCNDALCHCAHQEKAMGDVAVPAVVTQEACTACGGETPCHSEGLGLSMWYVPSAGEIDLPTSQHPVTWNPQYPETGLLHQTTRRFYTEDGILKDGTNGQPESAQHGWANLAFQTQLYIQVVQDE